MDKNNDNEFSACALIYDQFSPKLKNKLEGTSSYDNAKSSSDIIKLLMIIRGYCCQFDTLNDEYMSIVKSLKNLFYFFQKAEQTNSEFHQDFMALVEVIEEYGGTGPHTHFLKINKPRARTARAKPEHTSCPDQAAPGCPDVKVHPAVPRLAQRAARAKPEPRGQSPSREGKARAHLLSRPGRTRLPRR